MSIATKFELPGSKPQYNPDKLFSTKHIFLDLFLDFPNQILLGTCNLQLKPATEGLLKVDLNACDMEILQVKVNNRPAKYDHNGEILQIFLDKPTEIDVSAAISIDYYTEKSEMGLSFILPDEFYPEKPMQAWSKGESEMSRYWYPCLDFPKQITTTEIKVRLPKEMTAISNGRLLDERIAPVEGVLQKYQSQEDDTKFNRPDLNKEKYKTKFAYLLSEVQFGNYKVYHWKQEQPHPNYLVCLAAGEFCEIKDKYKNIEVNYYTTKGKEKELQLTGQKTPKMIEFFSQKFGVEYPWAKYSQIWVHDFVWGGMENTSATINTDRALADERSLIDYTFPEVLVAHELSHQWFGDLVAIDHWSHLWIKEGMATYSEQLWWEYEYGQEELDYYRLNEWREYLSESYKRATFTNIYRHWEDVYDRHSYTKAGTVYHMIRTIIGDSSFSKALKIFLTENRHKNVQSVDLLRSIEKASGRNLLPLFDQYLYTAGHPDFAVSYSWDESTKLAKLVVKQKQTTSSDDHHNLFKLKLPLAFGFTGSNIVETGSNLQEFRVNQQNVHLKTFEIALDQPEQSFYIPLNQKPSFVSFDHQNNYLKQLELEYPIEELKNQLMYAPDVIARFFAGEAIAKKSSLQSLKILRQAYKKEQFWAVRSELAKQIGKIKLTQTYDVIQEILLDKDTRVRIEAIKGLVEFKTLDCFNLLKNLLEKGDESYLTEAQIIKSLAAVAKHLTSREVEETIFLAQKVLREKQGWNEIIRSSGIVALSYLNDQPKALEIILDYTKRGMPTNLRISSIASLARACQNQKQDMIEKTIETINEITGENNIWMEMALVSSLESINSPKVIPILQTIAQSTMFNRTKRKAEEGIEKAQKNIGPDKSISNLRQEMDELKKENKELKSKLEEVLAKLSKPGQTLINL